MLCVTCAQVSGVGTLRWLSLSSDSVPVRGHAGPGAARHLESSTRGKIHLRSKLVVCRRRLRGGREELEVRKINLE